MRNEWPPTNGMSWLRRIDSRLKLLALIAACFVTQYLPVSMLPVWLAVLATVFLIPEMRRGEIRSMAHGALFFTLFWLAMTLLSELFAGKGWSQSVLTALPLAGRLLAFALIGMAFVGLSSPLETGRAITWFLQPIFGPRAWKAAMVIALTSWFLPETLRLSSMVRQSMRSRGITVSRWKRVVLVIGTSLRILEHTAQELAVGIASRRVDNPRSWKPR